MFKKEIKHAIKISLSTNMPNGKKMIKLFDVNAEFEGDLLVDGGAENVLNECIPLFKTACEKMRRIAKDEK